MKKHRMNKIEERFKRKESIKKFEMQLTLFQRKQYDFV